MLSPCVPARRRKDSRSRICYRTSGARILTARALAAISCVFAVGQDKIVKTLGVRLGVPDASHLEKLFKPINDAKLAWHMRVELSTGAKEEPIWDSLTIVHRACPLCQAQWSKRQKPVFFPPVVPKVTREGRRVYLEVDEHKLLTDHSAYESLPSVLKPLMQIAWRMGDEYRLCPGARGSITICDPCLRGLLAAVPELGKLEIARADLREAISIDAGCSDAELFGHRRRLYEEAGLLEAILRRIWNGMNPGDGRTPASL